jgi:putative molybdopterin biosynthesis protein
MGARQGRRSGRALTVPQVCHELNVGRVTVYGLIDSGELPAFRVGKNYRIEPEDLERYKAQGKAQVQAHGVVGAATERVPPQRGGDRP